jgi:hypothetical protein
VKPKALFLTALILPGFLTGGMKRQQNVAFLISPEIVRLGENVRILASSEFNEPGVELAVTGPSGRLPVVNGRSGGGPPFWWSGQVEIAVEGTYTVSLLQQNKGLASHEFKVPALRAKKTGGGGIWPTEREWNRGAENLYSAWLDALFQDADEEESWRSLHAVTQNRDRNILHDSLSLGEDDPGGRTAIIMEPDCADAPYFFRAYFAWKMRLPFGFHKCSRGSLEKAPECREWLSNSIPAGPRGEAQAFNSFLRLIQDVIHSGTARTLLESENSDYYPVPLTREDLRPGVVFADPYGHTLVLVRWLSQTAGRPGRIFAVDAQPDGTIGLRRFWQGNFLFSTTGVIGNPGFKAFRPIIKGAGQWRPMTNAEIRGTPDYANFSLQQKNMASTDFYDVMDRVINPEPLDPETAFQDLFSAFREQLVTRVLSVANGEEYKTAHPGAIIPMPNGAAVFQDVGLWEDYSTPNRDMRLLIALEVLLEFPEKTLRSPQFYRYPKGKTPEQVKKELEGLLQKWAREGTIVYTGSNGTPRTLTIEEIIRRKAALEMAYNPNDCVEIRWGAPEGSEELSACRQRAPAPQLEKMKSLRHWFRERRRPPT